MRWWLTVAVLVVLGSAARAQDQTERLLWDTVRSSGRAEQIEVYLRAYPNGAFAAEARQRLVQLRGGAPTPAPGKPGQPAAPALVAPPPPAPPASAPIQAGLRLEIDQQLYAPFEPIVARWSGARPASTGLLSIRVEGGERVLESISISPPYANPPTTQRLAGRPPGRYEIRFETTPPNGSVTARVLLAQIVAVVAADAQAAGARPGTVTRVATDHPAYAPFEPIVVTWTDMRALQARVLLRRVGAPEVVEQTTTTFNQPQGRFQFPGHLPGDYEVTVEAQADPAGISYNEMLVLARAAFTIQASAAAAAAGQAPRPGTQARIQVERASYAPFEPIVLTWSDIRTQTGRVVLRQAGATDIVEQRVLSFFNAPAGRAEIAGRLPGSYEVTLEVIDSRGSWNDPFVLARTAFTVAAPGAAPVAQAPPAQAPAAQAPAVQAPAAAAQAPGARPGTQPRLQPERATYAPFESVVVTWSDIRSPSGRLVLRQTGATDILEQRVLSFYNAPNGRGEFPGRLPGEYDVVIEAPDARGTYNEPFVLARAHFTVDAGGGAPTPGQAAPQVQQASAPARLGNLNFTDRPAAADFGRFAGLLAAVGQATQQSCAGTGEAYAWTTRAGEEARLQAIIAEANQTLQAGSFNVTRLPLTLDNALAYRATGSRSLLLTWYLQGTDFFLVVCPGS